MILCRDCKHFRLHVTYYPNHLGVGRDVSPEKSTCRLTDLVTGNGESGTLCTWERDKGACGPGAINFVPKPEVEPGSVSLVEREVRSWWRRFF